MAGLASPTDSGVIDREHGILTVIEVARELRCSKSHVSNLIRGKVPGVQPLPSVPLGRRRLVRKSSLHEWIRTNEQKPG